MPFAPEFLWPLLTAILGIAIAWGLLRYKTRDKRLDPLTERETRRIMDDPGPEPMKDDAPQPRGNRPAPKS